MTGTVELEKTDISDDKEKFSEPYQEAKLEDILKSIKNMIDHHEPPSFSSQEDCEDDINIDATKTKSSVKKTEIDNQQQKENAEDILNLTEIVPNDKITRLSKNDMLAFKDVKKKIYSKFNKFADKFKYFNYYPSKGNELNIMLTDLVRPLISDWLDKNLPNLLEKAISEEMNKITKHK